MERFGLGTPATRAGIIENLKSVGYVSGRGKSLVITPKGEALIEVLRKLNSRLISPELTAEWEKALDEIYRKRLGFDSYRTFLKRITEFVKEEIHRIMDQKFEVKLSDKREKKFRKKKRRAGGNSLQFI